MTRSLGVSFVGIIVGVIVLGGACNSGPANGHITIDSGVDDSGSQSCVFDSDCTVGFCNNGLCVTCPGTPCNAGYTCTAGGTCVAGDAGSTSTDSGTTPRPDGGKDAGGCTMQSECGQQACINGQCAPCTTTPQCNHTGYICKNSQCVPGCLMNSDCTGLGAGYWCDTTSNQCTWGCLPGTAPACGNFCCNLGTCNTTNHQCSGFTEADGGINMGDGGIIIPNGDGGIVLPDGGFTLGDGGSSTGLCFGGAPPTNSGLLILWFVNCGCDLPATCNVNTPGTGYSQTCAPLTGTCCIASGGFGCTSGSQCCSGVCNTLTCQ
jgi:hypothetical protein